jgi:hypothetical protein
LEVKGSKDSIDFVAKQLSHLSGNRLPVSANLWAELMRTRTLLDPLQAAVACIQEVSGARIHIDRDVLQIQLFGPARVTKAAQLLLKELESMIVVEAVDVENAPSTNPQRLSDFAHEYCVSLQVKEKQIVVIGVKDAVLKAARELHQFVASESPSAVQEEVSESAQMANRAIVDAMSQLRTMGENISASPSFPTVAENAASVYLACVKQEESFSTINNGTDQQFFVNTLDSLPPFIEDLGTPLEHQQYYAKTADSLPPYMEYTNDNHIFCM